MDNFDEDLDNEVNDIISQIKNQGNSVKNVETVYPELKPEDAESFILQELARLVTDISTVIDRAKEKVDTASEIEAFATLTKAKASAIEIFQKRIIADNKNKNQKEISKMALELKSGSEDSAPTGGIYLTREEIFQGLMNRVKEEPKTDPEPPAIDV